MVHLFPFSLLCVTENKLFAVLMFQVTGCSLKSYVVNEIIKQRRHTNEPLRVYMYKKLNSFKGKYQQPTVRFWTDAKAQFVYMRSYS